MLFRSIEEIEIVSKELGTYYFAFVDDDFIGSKQKGFQSRYEFARKIINKGIKINFRIATRINNIDNDLLTILKEAGLTSIDIGVESINKESLKLYNKGISKEVILNKIEIISKLGLKFRATMIPLII